MKKWFVGVDGGGTKTDFAVSTEDGKTVELITRPGCSYQTIGIRESVKLIVDGVHACLTAAGTTLADCAGCCVGMPCFGENAGQDQSIIEKLSSALAPAPVYVANDVEVGWAGSLECEEGIHIVAGTGSIAFGRGKDRQTARCGGWNEFFGDEGSCYWIGRQTMSLFTKEADGRAPKSALYEEVRRALKIEEDFSFTDAVRKDVAPYRDKVAQFQRYALAAAKAGDAAAAVLYEAAAGELALMVKAIQKKLKFSPGPVKVSYSGGLFRAEELILEPLRKQVEALGCTLQQPKRSAIDGALLLAIEHFAGRN